MHRDQDDPREFWRYVRPMVLGGSAGLVLALLLHFLVPSGARNPQVVDKLMPGLMMLVWQTVESQGEGIAWSRALLRGTAAAIVTLTVLFALGFART